MSGFSQVTAFVSADPYQSRDGWPRCFYERTRFCGQEAVICDCPSCPVKCAADAAAFQAQRRAEALEARRASAGAGDTTA